MARMEGIATRRGFGNWSLILKAPGRVNGQKDPSPYHPESITSHGSITMFGRERVRHHLCPGESATSKSLLTGAKTLAF
jgi:hypothetical protein